MAKHPQHEQFKKKAIAKIKEANSDKERLKVFLEDEVENLQTLANKLPAGPLQDEANLFISDRKADIPNIVSTVVLGSE